MGDTMKWNTLSKSESEKIMTSWTGSAKEDLSNKNYEEEKEIRETLISCMEEALLEIGISQADISKNAYKFDLIFGLKLFDYFQTNTDMNSKRASDGGIWRYLSIKVVPDIVYSRWGDNPSRYWKTQNRIWLRSLWWYIYLSWQGSVEETFETLKGNSTDEIVQLTERSGRFGYRTSLYRAIMKEYGTIDKNVNKRNTQIFRQIMKLNTARANVIEPSLMDGGENQYVINLFKYFIK